MKYAACRAGGHFLLKILASMSSPGRASVTCVDKLAELWAAARGRPVICYPRESTADESRRNSHCRSARQRPIDNGGGGRGGARAICARKHDTGDTRRLASAIAGLGAG